jgi:hypothetical protein
MSALADALKEYLYVVSTLWRRIVRSREFVELFVVRGTKPASLHMLPLTSRDMLIFTVSQKKWRSLRLTRPNWYTSQWSRILKKAMHLELLKSALIRVQLPTKFPREPQLLGVALCIS